MNERSIALNRFGLGARLGDGSLADAPGAPRAWLTAQIAAYDPAPEPMRRAADSAGILRDLATYQDEGREARRRRQDDRATAAPMDRAIDDMGSRQRTRRVLRAHYNDAVNARVAAAVDTQCPFMERMVHFWANHFAVSADKITVAPLAGAFEFEAIRPHVAGRFGGMLKAAERHPAMLLYLDQADSIGPGSRFGQRPRVAARNRGLNENLAREILELHTLGVRTGYGQADVTELARALTGWTVPGVARRVGAQEVTGGSAFFPDLHEPGSRAILGKTYAQEGAMQIDAVLDDLARHPATARHLAVKLSRHFAGDTPPPAMVARLEQAFLRSDGDLPTIYKAVIASPEAWLPQPVKFRSPWEWSLAALRALGPEIDKRTVINLQEQLGQRVWRPGQPSGFDDITAAWAGPDAIMRRVEAAERLAQRTGETDARALAEKLFPGAVRSSTAEALRRAESPGQALALLLVAPEMMRR